MIYLFHLPYQFKPYVYLKHYYCAVTLYFIGFFCENKFLCAFLYINSTGKHLQKKPCHGYWILEINLWNTNDTPHRGISLDFNIVSQLLRGRKKYTQFVNKAWKLLISHWRKLCSGCRRRCMAAQTLGNREKQLSALANINSQHQRHKLLLLLCDGSCFGVTA